MFSGDYTICQVPIVGNLFQCGTSSDVPIFIAIILILIITFTLVAVIMFIFALNRNCPCPNTI